ncbi:MAG: trypsin-like peptidase domain-containing protein [Actinobacteria bacterium]|nr:trypsin-like peptidase domain-containing protein [Actinomycetota bacterium]
MKKVIKLKIFPACFIIVLIATFLVFGISCTNVQAASSTTNTSDTPAVTTQATVAAIANNALKEFNSEVSAIVDKIIPSVVSIDVILNAGSTNAQNAEGVGSGIIYKQDGYIITNNHVAGNANKITVTLNNGINYEGTLVGADANTDVAVVKINATNLVPAVFVNEDTQKVGDFVLAVGSPFGVQQTITNGIVSGLDRNVPMSANTLPFVDLIQTDAPINPGNSGGPLVNINAEVIGMNTLGLSTSGSSAGIGFAIPTDTVTVIADEIIKTGSAQLPYIGITIGNNTSNIIGVLINTVTPGGPANKAGIKAGDILTDFNNEKLHNPYDLLGNIIQHQIGETVTIKYNRGGTTGTATVVLEKRPSNTSVSSG